MTQNVLDYSQNPSGIELMDTYLAGMAENQLTSHSGVSRPSYAQSGTFWIDTSTTPWTLKQFNGTNDVVVGTLDQTNLYFTARRALGDKNGNDITTKYVTVTGTAAKATADADGNTISSTYVKTTGTAAKATADADGNTISSTYAKKGADNTFSGTNTFTGQLTNAKSSPYLILQDTAVTKGTNPSSNTVAALLFNPNTDSTTNADCMGRVHCQVKTNGDVEVSMFAHRNISGDTTEAALTVTNKVDGTQTATGPTPTSATDSSTNIATTAWFRMAITNLGVQHLTKYEDIASSVTTYTAPIDGFIRVKIGATYNWQLYINGEIFQQQARNDSDSCVTTWVVIPVKQGDVLTRSGNTYHFDGGAMWYSY